MEEEIIVDGIASIPDKLSDLVKYIDDQVREAANFEYPNQAIICLMKCLTDVQHDLSDIASETFWELNS